MKSWSGSNKVIIYAILGLLFILELAPVVLIFVNSFRADAALKSSPVGLPTQLHFVNFIEAWNEGGYIYGYRNNLIVALFTCTITTTFTVLAAYSIAKLKVAFRQFFIGYFLVTMSFPGFIYLIPDYFMFQRLGLVNNLAGIIIIYSAIWLPFSFLLLRSYFLNISNDLIECAVIDGASQLRIIRDIVVPISKPMILTIILIVAVRTWNDFLFANTFLHDFEVRTVSVRFFRFTSKYDINLAKIYAAGCISIAPIIALFLLFQRQFIEGLTQGSVKG